MPKCFCLHKMPIFFLFSFSSVVFSKCSRSFLIETKSTHSDMKSEIFSGCWLFRLWLIQPNKTFVIFIDVRSIIIFMARYMYHSTKGNMNFCALLPFLRVDSVVSNLFLLWFFIFLLRFLVSFQFYLKFKMCNYMWWVLRRLYVSFWCEILHECACHLMRTNDRY